MDLFEVKNIKPMLIGVSGEAFDSDEFIYELKLDGERCIAYLDEGSTELQNKRNFKMLPKVPELKDIHKCISAKCILDGELAIFVDGKPDFSKMQSRSLTSSTMKIQLASKQYPACFTAFDILYHSDRQVTDLPLMERKKLLQNVVKEENAQFSISRYIERQGMAFYQLAEEQGLEGIVSKRRDSKYYFDKRTKDWIKIKNLLDDDFVVCGYVPKDNHMNSIILAQYDGDKMVFKGHVTLGVSGSAFHKIRDIQSSIPCIEQIPTGNENAVWIKPELVCTVKYMMLNDKGGMRQPVFKGLRGDKSPKDCKVKSGR